MDWIIILAIMAVLLFLIYLKSKNLMREGNKKTPSPESKIFEAEIEPETVTEEPQAVEEPKNEPEKPAETKAEAPVEKKEKPAISEEDQWNNWTALAGRWQMTEAELANIVKMLFEEEVDFLLKEYQKRCGIVFREVNSKDTSWEDNPAKKVIGMRIKLLLKAQKEFKKKRR